MIIKRQKEFGRRRQATKAIENAKLIKKYFPEYEDLSISKIAKKVSNKYAAQPTNPRNEVAIARFIKKHGQEPQLGELNEIRLKRYNGKYWPESANKSVGDAKGKKKLLEEIEGRVAEQSIKP